MNSINILIREFAKDDIETLANLTNELGYSTTVSEMIFRMENILRNPAYKTIVATIDGKVVGYIGLTRSYFWEQNGEFVRIQALVVKTDCRKCGIGKKLVEYAENWAREIDVKLILVNCGNRTERESAHKFYHKMGFETKSTGYIKKLVH